VASAALTVAAPSSRVHNLMIIVTLHQFIQDWAPENTSEAVPEPNVRFVNMR
jgi:hypothetical protein